MRNHNVHIPDLGTMTLDLDGPHALLRGGFVAYEVEIQAFRDSPAVLTLRRTTKDFVCLTATVASAEAHLDRNDLR